MIRSLSTHLKQYVLMFASCLQYIAGDALGWAEMRKETGGPLLVLRTHAGRFVIMLAGPGGPNTCHENAHLRMDTDYVTELIRYSQERFGIQFGGDWHSHWDLGIDHPSPGDEKHIYKLARRHNIPQMIQLILTRERANKHKRNVNGSKIRVSAFIFNNSNEGSNGSCRCAIKVLPDHNPIRMVLEDCNILRIAGRPSFDNLPLDRIIYDGLESSVESYKIGQEVQSDLAKQLTELPDEIAELAELHTYGDRMILSLPLPDGCRIGVTYVCKETPPRVFSVSAVCPHAKAPFDITGDVLMNNNYMPLSLIYKQAINIIMHSDTEGFFYKCGQIVSKLYKTTKV